MDACNDFSNAPLKAEPFDGIAVRDGMVTVSMPACSVAEIRLKV